MPTDTKAIRGRKVATRKQSEKSVAETREIVAGDSPIDISGYAVDPEGDASPMVHSTSPHPDPVSGGEVPTQECDSHDAPSGKRKLLIASPSVIVTLPGVGLSTKRLRTEDRPVAPAASTKFEEWRRPGQARKDLAMRFINESESAKLVRGV